MIAYKLAVPKLEQRISNLVELISDIKDETGEVEEADGANESNQQARSCSVPKQTIGSLNVQVN